MSKISRLQVVVFYPADWDPECQAILSAFSALSDQFSSCHVSMVKTKLKGYKYLKSSKNGLLNFPGGSLWLLH